MKLSRKMAVVAFLLAMVSVQAFADEGMWILKEMNQQTLNRMRELGFNASADGLYSETQPCVANAVVIFGGGCTGITVSDEGLIFTNHHCGFDAIQKSSTVEHDYLKDGFVSQTKAAELPIKGLAVKYLRETVDVSDRINSKINGIDDEQKRLAAADSIGDVLCDSIGAHEFTKAEVVPFYNNNKYYLVVYDVYRDVRMVFAPPSSLGKFGGDTDNWMWPRQTCDFSVFRVYANKENKPALYDKENVPYRPKYAVKVSLQGYKENDYAMTIGFPGSTDRFLSSWGVKQRIEDENNPRIEVRGIKQSLWKKAMQADHETKIQYASKYAGSSNYWKNAIGMNKGLKQLNVIGRKQDEEAAFAKWVSKDPQRQAKYGEVLNLLQSGYATSGELKKNSTYLLESLLMGAEIVRLAYIIENFDLENASTEEIVGWTKANLLPFYKDYNAALDQQVLGAMMRVAAQRMDVRYKPDIFKSIDRKYKGDYQRYAKDVFKKTNLVEKDKLIELLSNPKKFAKRMKKDPACQLAKSVLSSYFTLSKLASNSSAKIEKGRRLYVKGLLEMNPNKTYTSDANFTMRMSYGSIGGYRPYDAAWYDYYSTSEGVLEKQNPNSDEFYVQPEILTLLKKKQFGPYGEDGVLHTCFLSNNDITGGNSGSPVFDGNAHLIGLAFDGNWEAMSGDIAFEPTLQRTISVDIRYVLYVIDQWGKCPRLIRELDLVK